MKYTHTRFIVLLIFASVFAVISQTTPTTNSPPKKYVSQGAVVARTRHGNEYTIIVLKGHEYAVRDDYRAGGITHAHSCPCLNK